MVTICVSTSRKIYSIYFLPSMFLLIGAPPLIYFVFRIETTASSHHFKMSALRRGIVNLRSNNKMNVVVAGAPCRAFWDYAPEPFHPIPDKFPKVLTAEEAVKNICSDHTVFIQGSSATPNHLVNAMTGECVGVGPLFFTFPAFIPFALSLALFLLLTI